MEITLQQRLFAAGDFFDAFDENWDIKYYAKRDRDKCAEVWRRHDRRTGVLHRTWLYDGKTGDVLGSIRKSRDYRSYEVTLEGQRLGQIRRDNTFLTNQYYMDCRGWDAVGKMFGRSYEVTHNNYPIMTIHKSFGRHIYRLNIEDPEDEVPGILLTLAIISSKRLYWEMLWKR